MSPQSHKVGALALASAAAAIAALGAQTAQAAQTSKLDYRCKFPLIGTQPLSLDITLDIPDTWPVGEPTAPFAITAKASAGGTTAQGLGLVEGLKTVGGVTEAQKPGKGTASRARVELPDGSGVNVRVPINVEPYTVVPPIPNPLVLNASGTTPSLTLDVPGTAKIVLTELILNLYGHYEDGTPVEGLTTPATDIDRQPYADIDGDPGTFNVPCKLDPAGQNLQVGTFELIEEGGGSDTEAPSAPVVPQPSDYVESDFQPTSINIKWRPATDNVGVTQYKIDYEGGPAGGVLVPAGANTGVFAKNITGLGEDSEYIFTITALDAAGNESEGMEQTHFTTVAGTTPPPNVKPTKPGTPTGTSTETSISLSWGASTDSDGTIAGYKVFAGSTQVASTTGATTATITGLQPNTNYTYTVVATDDDGAASDASAAGTVKTKADTTAPSNPTVSGTTTQTAATLTWTASTDNIGVTGYDVFVGTATTPAASVSGLTATINGLTANTPYAFRVVAKDAAGNKSSGGTVNLSTKPAGTTGSGIVNYKYTLKGSTTINTLTRGSLALSGSINADLKLADGSFVADLLLNDTTARLTTIGFLPVTVKVGLVPSGKTTGSLVDGVLKTQSKVRIKLKEIKLFGAIPIQGGNTCQTKSLSTINLQSTQSEFLPLSGGPIAGKYAISDLNGCGALNAFISPLTAGGNNSINLNLIPAS